ncbi:hypothetical protein CL617_04045 [archaeon]|nr:hypothetical protein [archaeon]|tara:strand:+ start:3554 stop:3952 length:399 start_codon:yes stop_codon:yes gene_type:complete
MSKNNDYHTLTRSESRKIKDQLDLYKVKQKELAEYIGTSSASLSRRLSTSQGFPLDQLESLKLFFNSRTPLSSLENLATSINGIPKNTNEYENKLIDLYESYVRLPNAFENLSSEEIDEIKIYLNAIYERYK